MMRNRCRINEKFLNQEFLGFIEELEEVDYEYDSFLEKRREIRELMSKYNLNEKYNIEFHHVIELFSEFKLGKIFLEDRFFSIDDEGLEVLRLKIMTNIISNRDGQYMIQKHKIRTHST